MRIFGIVLTAFVVSCASSSDMQAADLTAHTWKATEIGGKKPLAGTTVTLEFGADGKIKGKAQNSYFGSYDLTGEAIEFGPIGATRMFHDDPKGAMDQESRYFKLLGEADHWRGVRGRLELLARNHPLLVFAPAE